MISAREDEWANWMRASLAGDGAAYRVLLEAMSPILRAIARNGFARAGVSVAEADDVLQETLLAIHLKRHTWQQDQPLGPWVAAIARYKLIDHLRRRGRRLEVPIEPLIEILAQAPPEETISDEEVRRLAEALQGRQGEVVRAVAISRRSIGEAAAGLRMSEGAVRVALHRGLKQLATLYRLENA
ncbi:MAG: polymerase, sigma-24 subunit, subfamily [Hyphomicrobiales bacterium]|nr:polymerase, sigma-24 subunit, subfamily [Hyphomicrobiales bacterium]